MDFDYSKLTVAEADAVMEAGRFAPEVREALAKVTGKPLKEIEAMPVTEYRKVLRAFLSGLLNPLDDPN